MTALFPCCGYCGSSKEPLLRCSTCEVMLYCSTEHQASHRNEHGLACDTVKRQCDYLRSEEQALRAHHSLLLPANVFDTHVGRSWGLAGTRRYMRALHYMLGALRNIPSLDATQASLDHALNILRLNPRDTFGVQYLIPALFLRLGRDQDCYDFVKWYCTKGQEFDYDSRDMGSPFLHIRNANALESVEYMCGSSPHLNRVAAIALLKIKLLLDVKSLKNASVLADRLPLEIVGNIQRYLPESAIISSDKRTMYRSDYNSLIEDLSSQVDLLYTTVNRANEHSWRALLKPERHLKAQPVYCRVDSKAEMQFELQSSIDAWLESPGALEIIRAKLSNQG